MRIKNLICPKCREFPEHTIDNINPELTNNVPLQVIICTKCKTRYLDLILNKLTKYRLEWFLKKSEEDQHKLLKMNNISIDDFKSLINEGIDGIWKKIEESKEET